jgi:hypothetical protein
MLALFWVDFWSTEIFKYCPNLSRYLLTLIIIILPTLGYCDQLRKMISQRSSEFFNLDIALILFFSNSLRFLYWIYEPWEGYLLGQAIAVFLIQAAMAFFSFSYDNTSNEKGGFTGRKYFSRNLRYYLNIRKIRHGRDFFTALLGFEFVIILTFSISSWLFGRTKICTITILIANLTDTLVSVPQFIRIVIRNNIKNASTVLVLQFLLGDLMKFLLFCITGTGWPFVFGALLQICVDGTVAVSFFWQSRNKGRVTPVKGKHTESFV